MRNTAIRIALWASVGFLISAGWGFYFTIKDKANPPDPAVYAAIYATQPVAGIYSYFDFPMGLRAVEIENAATYALIGLMLAMIRRRQRPLPISN